MLDNFNDYVKMEAICIYLKSFGYKARVNNNAIVVEVQDLDQSIKCMCDWDTAREFIKVRSQS